MATQAQRKSIKVMVRGGYDLQNLRIQMGNRIVGNFKAKLGQDPGKTEDASLDKEGKQILANLRKSYRKITDGVVKLPDTTDFKGDEVISSYTELCLVSQYVALERQEHEHFKQLEAVLEFHPIYTQYLKAIDGVGAAISGILISEIDIEKAQYPSSLWKYAGLDVAGDGRGRSRREDHLIDVEYVAKGGEIKKKKSITFNPFLKTKLMGVAAGCLLRSGNERYSKIYNDYKHRLENHRVYGLANDKARIDAMKAKGKEYSPKAHRHQMAMRYMMKMFLLDLYKAWRTLEGLPVAQAYDEAKLGMKHSA